MATSEFPINNDIDYEHNITNNNAVLDLTTLDWYGIHWFYRTASGSKVAIAQYDVAGVGLYTANIEEVTPATGDVISHIQKEDMDIPVGVKIYWQPYSKDADVLHGTNFHGAGCEIFAGVSCDADTLV